MNINRSYLMIVTIYALFLGVVVTLADFHIAHWAFTTISRIPYGDKIGHIVLMGLFSFLFNSTLNCRTTSLGFGRIFTGSLIVYIIVVIEELSQFWIVSRNVEALDLLSDITGIYLFGLLASYNYRQKVLKTERLEP